LAVVMGLLLGLVGSGSGGVVFVESELEKFEEFKMAGLRMCARGADAAARKQAGREEWRRRMCGGADRRRLSDGAG
jgi:hypothetical protein